MKIFRQALIILTLYFIGEFLSKQLHLPIPGNILGMILLFILLNTGALKLDKVDMVSNFFLDHLAFFFLPASIGLMTSFESIKSSAFKIIAICVITTFIVMAITSLLVQFVSNKLNKKY